MFLTIRAILYAIAGIIFILLFSGTLTPIGSFATFNAILIIVGIIDFLTAPDKKKIKIRRILDEKLSLGTKNTIALTIANLSRFKSVVRVKDEFPQEFELKQESPQEPDKPVKPLEFIINGFSEEKAQYSVVPTRRGQYKFGNVHVRTLGALGIVGRQFKLDLAEPVKVYPNIKDISTYRLLARKNRLLETGLKPSKIFGIGTDFEYLREYVPDDEFRKINWKASARRSKLITSQYQTERSQNIFIVIEAGRMMTSRIDRISKLDYTINAALLLSYVAMDKGDNVGLMVFSNEIKAFLPPKRGKKQLSLIVESLYRQEPELLEPDYGTAIRYLSLKNRKRSLVIFFTDLIDTDVSKAIVVYSRSLYPAHLPMVVTVTDTFLHEEAGRMPESMPELYHKAVAEDLIHQREQVKSVLHRGGVLTLDVPPHQLTPALITKYLSIKARNRL